MIDFHSLRYTFVTRLSQAGVHPRTAQALARHAKIETTMDTYTDLHLLDLRAAVEKLDAPSLEDAEATVSPTVPSEGLPGASECQEDGGVDETPKRRRRGRKRQADAEKSGGRYWTRTSDPQLVELEVESQSAARIGASGAIADATVPPAGPHEPAHDPIALARILLERAATAAEPAPLLRAADALLREASLERGDSGGLGCVARGGS